MLILYFHGATHGLRALLKVGLHTNLYESISEKLYNHIIFKKQQCSKYKWTI